MESNAVTLSPGIILGLGFLGSLLAGAATGVGALPALLTRRISARAECIILGFGAGVMLAAISFSLIIPALEYVHGGTPLKIAGIALGIICGALFLWLADHYFPHEHFFVGREGPEALTLKRTWLFVVAITLHNFPEGLAVGVGFGDSVANGIALAIGIGVQNMPEGLVVAMALVTERYKPLTAVWIALLTGLVEPIGGLFGAGIVGLARSILPYGLAFAAGAMLFVTSGDIIPESHRRGYQKEATFGLVAGFVLMMVLDVGLG